MRQMGGELKKGSCGERRIRQNETLSKSQTESYYFVS